MPLSNDNINPGNASPVTEIDGFLSDHNGIFYAAIQRSRMPMILTDPNQLDNPIVFFNEAFLSISGYSGEEILGRNCRFLQGPHTDEATVNKIRQAIKTETDCNVELLNYRKDGSQFWNALYMSPVYDNEGKLVYYFASQLDISRRVKSEELLRQAQKLETLGQFTGGIAHDFNNMLTVMIGNVRLAQSGIEKGQDVTVYLERAMQAAKSSDRLTQQLLSFARKQRMASEPTNIAELIQQVETMMERVLPSEVRVSSELPDDSWTVDLDRSHAESAFLNVLLNARDAIVAKGGGGKIKMKLSNLSLAEPRGKIPPGRYVVFSIIDNGIGMDAATLERIYEPFFTTKAVGSGTGMGMSMVHGFTEQTGAILDVTSELGMGTTVSFYFKADEADVSEHGSIRVLLVEDNQHVRDMTVDYLREHNFTVRHADSGDEAVELLQNGYVPDIMFSDILMPGKLDGFALASLVRKEYPSVRILLTSGWTNDEKRNEGFEILAKPYDLTKLASLLGTMAALAPATYHEG